MKILHTTAFLLIASLSFAQTPKERERIIKDYDLVYLSKLADNLKNKYETKRQYALQQAAIYGWPVTTVDSDGQVTSVLIDVEGNSPVYYTIDSTVAAAISTRTNFLNTGGGLNLDLNGEDMRVGVWDIKMASATHQEFNAPGQSSRIIYGDPYINVNSVSFHATQVTGIMISEGENPIAKGMAPAATAISYDYVEDFVEATTEAANGLLLSNHSYGQSPTYLYDWKFGAYDFLSQDWDDIMFNAPHYLAVFSAGNAGSVDYNSVPMPGAGSTYDKLTGFGATSKNSLVVANAVDATVNADGELISIPVIWETSTPGPTDDLRIKPDITGNGYLVTNASSITDSSYSPPLNSTGTSFSAPNVTGSLLLLQQHYKNLNGGNFMKAATLKGLAMHTADDIDVPGPDSRSGWGLLNSLRAAQAITDKGAYSSISENVLQNSESFSFNVLSDGSSPLMVSISWTDRPGLSELIPTIDNPVANNSTPLLINDLNVKVTQNGNVFLPYMLTSPSTSTTGNNIVDPYERVDITNPSGVYTVTISHAGTLTGGSQNYSLIVTGIIACTASTTDITVTEQVLTGENDVKHSIETITANNSINNGATAYYRAGNFIQFSEGFLATEGSFLLAEIGDCGIISLPPASSGRMAMEQEETDNTKNYSDKGLLLYPNPANNTVTIKINEGIINKINLSSIDGKAIDSKLANNNIYLLEVSTLENGIYVIEAINNTGKSFYEKLIISK
ncbi:S8/S53 family peptidase [Flavobacterium suzhouense]|uniref:S8/S53 family peptidase n=1 Tax=Flavobacterium suzhouense TaxID=1529638 RepID=A0ABW5NUM1_9FLAO